MLNLQQYVELPVAVDVSVMSAGAELENLHHKIEVAQTTLQSCQEFLSTILDKPTILLGDKVVDATFLLEEITRAINL